MFCECPLAEDLGGDNYYVRLQTLKNDAVISKVLTQFRTFFSAMPSKQCCRARCEPRHLFWCMVCLGQKTTEFYERMFCLNLLKQSHLWSFKFCCQGPKPQRSMKYRDLSRDDWIKELIKRKWSSRLVWAVGAAEKKTSQLP